MASRADLSALQFTPERQRVAAVADVLGIEGWGPTTAAALAQVASRPEELAALALTAPEYVLA